MICDPASKADSEVVATWIAGWALSRGLQPPTPAYGGFRVDVGAPDQKARYVFADASHGMTEAARAIAEPHVFIKVCAPPQMVEPLLAPGWVIRSVSFMMTIDDLHQADAPLAGGYHRQSERLEGGCGVTLLSGDGDVAARGRAFIVGSTAVFDQIETSPDHRRRGLGRAVMRELGALARQDGAVKGSLVATPDGRALYSALGWRLHSLYTTAVRET